MKMTKLKYTACNGTLEFDENNPGIAVCEYCHTKYVIGGAGSDHARLGTPPPDWYMPQNSSSSSSGTPDSSGGKKATGWEPYGWKRGTTLVRIGLVPVFAIDAKGLIRRRDMDHSKKPDTVMDLQTTEVMGEEEKDFSSTPNTPFTGAFAMVAEVACGKPADEITPQELERLQRLATKYTDTGSVLAVGYSYDDPYTSDTASLTWVPLSGDTVKLDTLQLTRFTGLKELDLNGSISSGDLDGLPIQGVSCYGSSLTGLAERLDDAAIQLKEINITASLESLDSITALIGAERIPIYGGHLADTTMLANLKNMTSLALDYCNDVADSLALSVMPWSKKLPIESKGLRDTGFMSKMPELTFLTLEDASILHMNGLEDDTALTSLSTDRYGEMKNYDAISGLTGLQKLFLDIPYSCAKPDLNGLTGLIGLTASGFDSISFLRNIPQLTTLVPDGCQINDTGAFAGLIGLKELSCSHVYGDSANWNFVGGTPRLEILNLSGISIYEDVPSLSLIPTLQELYLNGMECEPNFSKLAASESLTALEMDGMKFCTNARVSSGDGIYSINYDKVPLDEHTDFLISHPDLKNLSLAGNTLTNVDSASSLGALEALNISGNYVMDLKPPEILKALKVVNSTGNPIENYWVLGDGVLILK